MAAHRNNSDRLLEESEERYRRLVEASPEAIFVYLDGRIAYVNPAGTKLFGARKPEELLGKSILDFIHPEYREVVKARLRKVEEEGEQASSLEQRLVRPDGRVVYVEATSLPIVYEGRPAIQALIRDITERKRAEEARRKSEARHRAVVDNAFDAIITATAEGEIRSFNRRAEAMFGYEAREVIGRPLALLVPERVRAPRPNGSRRYAEEAEPGRTMEVTARSKEGVEFPVELSIAEVREGDDVLLTSIIRDITERKVFEAQLTYQALHDSLTDLPNRTLFLDRLEHALAQMRRREEITMAVLFIDLDDFKNVNDSLGHEMGDEMLKAASVRLRRCMRPRDTAARLGGDEFAILLEDIGGLRGAARVAERIIEELRACFELRGHEVFVTPSIGISLCGSSDQRRAENMLRDADLAMYKAKESGKANYQVFDPIMYQKVLERLDLEKDLRRAVEHGEFVLHYQPKVLLKTGKIAGVEALVRWEHPERGLVLPEEFVPVAEETALISLLGAWVLEETCRQASRWREGGFRELLDLVSVNLSAIQLQRPDLIEEVAGVLRRCGLDPCNLSLEITESVVMSEAPHNIARLDELKNLGVKLAIDDFGTGYSSLSYLRRFPVSYLKIDRSFIEGLRESPEDTAVVSGIIALAHVLGMETIAEGVETAEQLRALRDLGCDMAQGNYLSEPLTDEELPGFLATDPRW